MSTPNNNQQSVGAQPITYPYSTGQYHPPPPPYQTGPSPYYPVSAVCVPQGHPVGSVHPPWFPPPPKKRQTDPNHNAHQVEPTVDESDSHATLRKYVKLLEQNNAQKERLMFLERETLELKSQLHLLQTPKAHTPPPIDLEDVFNPSNLTAEQKHDHDKVYAMLENNYSIRSINGVSFASVVNYNEGFLTREALQRQFKMYGLAKLITTNEFRGIPATSNAILRNGLRSTVLYMGSWCAHSIFANKPVTKFIEDSWEDIFGVPAGNLKDVLSDTLKSEIASKYFKWPIWFEYPEEHIRPRINTSSKEEMDEDHDGDPEEKESELHGNISQPNNTNEDDESK
eukprot:741293_1